MVVFGVPQISAMGMDHIAAATGQQIKLQYAFHLSVYVDRQVTEFGDLNKNIFLLVDITYDLKRQLPFRILRECFVASIVHNAAKRTILLVEVCTPHTKQKQTPWL